MTGDYMEFRGLPKVLGGDRRLTAALVSVMESITKALNEARQEISSLKEEVSELKKARAIDDVEINHLREDVKRMREIQNDNAVQMHHRFVEGHERSVVIAGLQQRVLEIEQI
jgi:regulator of replication initiation timing